LEKKLFGNATIILSDSTEIEEILRRFSEAKHAVERLCIDNKNGRLF